MNTTGVTVLLVLSTALTWIAGQPPEALGIPPIMAAWLPLGSLLVGVVLNQLRPVGRS